MSSGKTVTLNTGHKIPYVQSVYQQTSHTLANKIDSQLGYGTWQAAPGEVGNGVYEALKIGYRHLVSGLEDPGSSFGTCMPNTRTDYTVPDTNKLLTLRTGPCEDVSVTSPTSHFFTMYFHHVAAARANLACSRPSSWDTPQWRRCS